MTLTGSDNQFPLVRIMEDTVDPGDPTPTGEVHLKADAATKLLYTVDDAGTVTPLGGAGASDLDAIITASSGQDIADALAGAAAPDGTNVFATIADALVDPILLTEAAAPSTPAANKVVVYAKSDGRVYSKDDAGVEYGPFDTGGGAAGPKLYQDSLALHADGDEFTTTALTGWTLSGGLTTSDAAAITTEPYDATCLDVTFTAQGTRLLKSLPGSWTNLILTCHGLTSADAAGMIGLSLVDASGNGMAVTPYNDGGVYVWTVATYNYSGSYGAVGGGWTTMNGGPAASNYPFMMRIRKSGSNYYGAFSQNGGLSWNETSAITPGLTFNRFGVARHYSGGGSTPKLRVGRINVT